jgi:transposase
MCVVGRRRAALLLDYYLAEAAGLDVQLVNARDVKNAPGRPKTDKLDAVWQAKLTERGMLRPSFVPPAEIRELRDYTRLRTDLTRERTRYWQRLEKLLEDSLIKVSAVASSLDTKSVRDMLEALIAGERDPKVLAGLARGRMKAKYAALIEALTGKFDDHHAELARMLLDQVDALNVQIGKLTSRIGELIAAIPAAQGVEADGTAGPSAGTGPGAAVLPATGRLDEITGIGPDGAHVIIAEIGLDMSRFPTASHLVSWAKLSPRTIQSGPRSRGGKTGKGNPYLKGVLGEAAAAAARTDTFLGERYRRIVRRRGKLKALVAVARSILGQVAGARYRAPAPSEPDLPVIPASGSSKPLRTLRVAAAVLCPCAAGPCGRGCRRRVPGLWWSSRSARRPARVFLARRVRAGCPGA